MKAVKNWKTWVTIPVLALTILILGTGSSSDPTRQRPRAQDLVNTKVRNELMDLAQDAIPKPMLDPAIDDGATFSYFARPSFQLGIRGEPFATQVMDGHLWTGAAEWLLMIGDPAEPVVQRLWTLEKDYLPCINFTVERDGIAYAVKIFQFWLDDRAKTTPTNFIRVTAANTAAGPATASFAGAFMYGPRDHRSQSMRQMNFNPAWKYELTERSARRDGQIIYAYALPPNELQTAPGRMHRGGAFFNPRRTAPGGLAVYRRELAPGESFTAEFAMPHYPADPGLEDALAGAKFEERLMAFEAYWEDWLAAGARFEVAEDKVTHASKAYVIHALMSQNIISDREVEQHVNRFQYNRFWLRDSSFFVSMYERFGYPEVAGTLARHFYGYQRDDGNFVSQRGQLDGWGQTMWAFGNHARFTGDRAFAEEALPYVEGAVAWLAEALAEDAWGLMPPTDAFDNEMITGRYTGHNFWALTGLEAAADLARVAGRDDLAEKYLALRSEYRERFLARLREVAAERGGVMPPGMDVPGGTDWGNLLALYPGKVMDPDDPLVTATFDYIRRERMQEGIMMWQESMHHYLTERVAQTALLRGEQERALDDFYAMLLHTGAGHEGFEWTIFAWDGRDYCFSVLGVQTCNFPPHGWYAADLNLLYRNMLVREDGLELHLASAVSPEWAKPGDRIAVSDAPFYLVGDEGPVPGVISYAISFSETTAVLDITRLDLQGPAPDSARVVLHVPYFLEVKNVVPNGAPVTVSEGRIFLPLAPLVHEFEFVRLAVEPKSWRRSVDWYKKEYRRRWEESH